MNPEGGYRFNTSWVLPFVALSECFGRHDVAGLCYYVENYQSCSSPQLADDLIHLDLQAVASISWL